MRAAMGEAALSAQRARDALFFPRERDAALLARLIAGRPDSAAFSSLEAPSPEHPPRDREVEEMEALVLELLLLRRGPARAPTKLRPKGQGRATGRHSIRQHLRQRPPQHHPARPPRRAAGTRARGSSRVRSYSPAGWRRSGA
jgi:hypothetical protein